jgi:hypothetical protein
VNKLLRVLILMAASLSMSACGADRGLSPTPTFTAPETVLPVPTLILTNTPASTSTFTPTPTATATQTTTPIPLPSTDEIKARFNREIKPLITQLEAAKDDPEAGLPTEYEIVYVPQTLRLYTVQSILQITRPPDSGTGSKLYVLYKYSRGRTLGHRQGYSLNTSSETQEITTDLSLVMEEAGKFTLVETEKATGGSGSISLRDLVQQAVPPLKKLSSSNPEVRTDLQVIIGYACGIDMTSDLDYHRKAALLTFALGSADWAGIVQGIEGLT